MRYDAKMTQIIPAVDVLAGEVVRLMHGDYERVTVYSDDPVAQARSWIERGATRVHVVDLEGARTGVPDTDLWASLAAADIPFQIGGGIRTVDQAAAALESGAERVVMGTTAVWRPESLSDLGDTSRVVAAIDVRNGRAMGAGWLDEGREIRDVLDGLAAVGVGRILVTGIKTDGTMAGPELDLMKTTTTDGRFRVIASGGVGCLDHIAAVARLGCEAVIVGRALYEGRFTIEEALRHR